MQTFKFEDGTTIKLVGLGRAQLSAGGDFILQVGTVLVEATDP